MRLSTLVSMPRTLRAILFLGAACWVCGRKMIGDETWIGFVRNKKYVDIRFDVVDDARFGQVLHFWACRDLGDAVTASKFHCSQTIPCNVSFYVKGTVSQGFSTTTYIDPHHWSPDMTPDHVWTMCADGDGNGCGWGIYWPRPPLRYGVTPAFAANWTLVEYAYDGLYGDGREETEHHLMFEPHENFIGQRSLSANCSESYLADVRINGVPIDGRRLQDAAVDRGDL
mmetsp:Transcript_109058/g.326189  ORF Transcript_109058/g.326189 Transcript_109058/m.326189 type:complete len:227 (+) Transcript_109058:90-770(+)